MEPTRRLFLIRHGQTDLNRDRRFRGHTPAPLNDQGRLEAERAGELLKDSSLEIIYTSPMPRAVETAEIISGITGCRVETDESFIDIDYGDWQGLTVEQVIEKYGVEPLQSWKEKPGEFQFPNGDSVEEIRVRLGPALKKTVNSVKSGTAGVLSHLLVLKLCYLVMMELPSDWFWKISLDNGSVGAFQYSSEEGFIMESWNCLADSCKVGKP
ncbi:MAG: histidine phosphatase family protein [Actinobacteria bacterium]|nr:histidine phosphatase family protein [Actinomycetota bacterium]